MVVLSVQTYIGTVELPFPRWFGVRGHRGVFVPVKVQVCGQQKDRRRGSSTQRLQEQDKRQTHTTEQAACPTNSPKLVRAWTGVCGPGTPQNTCSCPAPACHFGLSSERVSADPPPPRRDPSCTPHAHHETRAGHARAPTHHTAARAWGRSFGRRLKAPEPSRAKRIYALTQLRLGTSGHRAVHGPNEPCLNFNNFNKTDLERDGEVVVAHSELSSAEKIMMIKQFARAGAEDEEVTSPAQWMDRTDTSSPDDDPMTSQNYTPPLLSEHAHDGCSEEDEEDAEEDEACKRRGPKKKRMTKGRQERFRARRIKANARERSRMHGLNDALENLRSIMPCHSKTQKLSKIETLRLARNYICALSEALEGGVSMQSRAFMDTLCKGLSQPTSNLVSGCLQLSPKPEERQISAVGYASSGLPSPPYGTFDSAHLLHLRSIKANLYDGHSTGVGTPPYEAPPTPPLSISSNMVPKQDTSPSYLHPHHYSPSEPNQGLYQVTSTYDGHMESQYEQYRHMSAIYRD
ncbi:hypothetical protein WMY93_011234 [Mugilogobius chulae]|uniref:BHLH domain-containing protein n=1 Tax=Mugilogobius chulae TaxID=88201 RepID=A0AAW0PE48_9GOBI